MSGAGRLWVGDEWLPFSLSAIAMVGLKDGDNLESMETYGELLAAEMADTSTRIAIARVSPCE